MNMEKLTYIVKLAKTLLLLEDPFNIYKRDAPWLFTKKIKKSSKKNPENENFINYKIDRYHNF